MTVGITLGSRAIPPRWRAWLDRLLKRERFPIDSIISAEDFVASEYPGHGFSVLTIFPDGELQHHHRPGSDPLDEGDYEALAGVVEAIDPEHAHIGEGFFILCGAGYMQFFIGLEPGRVAALTSHLPYVDGEGY